MPENLAKVLNVFTTIVVTLVVIATVAVVAPRIVGIYPYAVLSGSMEPEIPTGSLIYSKEVDPSILSEGDVITYMISRDATITHRITAIVEDENGQVRYQTQGDANDQPDTKLVHPDNVVGVPVLCVPYAGYVLNAVTTPPGSFLMLSFLALVIMFMFLPDVFAKDDEKELASVGSGANQGAYGASPYGGDAWNGGFEVPRGPGAYELDHSVAGAQQAAMQYPSACQRQVASLYHPAPQNAVASQQPWGQQVVGCQRIQQPIHQAARHLSPEECAYLAQRELARRAATREAQSQTGNRPAQGGRPNA